MPKRELFQACRPTGCFGSLVTRDDVPAYEALLAELHSMYAYLPTTEKSGTLGKFYETSIRQIQTVLKVLRES